MFSFNRVHIIGYQTQPVAVRQTPGGSSVTDLNLVVPYRFRTESGETLEGKGFHTVTIWGPMAEVAGKYVKASPETITAACSAVEAPKWNNFAVSLTNASGADSFPITSFTWIYLRTSSSDSVRATALENLLDWIYSDGQQYAAQEGYSELPAPLLAAVRKKAKELR